MANEATDPNTAEIIIEYLKLLVALAGIIAWPVALVAAILIFREQLNKLIGRIEAVSGPGGIGATFSEKLEASREAIEEAPTIPSEIPLNLDEDPYLNLALNYPEAAVLQAYNEIEQMIRSHLSHHNIKYPNQVSFMRHLLNSQSLPASLYKSYEALRQTRNAAVHAEKAVTTGEAIEYRNLTRRFMEGMKPVLDRDAASQK